VDSLSESKSFLAGGLDSLDHAMILLRLQERCGLEVPDEDVEACCSIRAILDYAAKPPNQKVSFKPN